MTTQLLVRVMTLALLGIACGPPLAALAARAPLGRRAIDASALRGSGVPVGVRAAVSVATGLALAALAPLPPELIPVPAVVVLASVPLIVIDVRLHRLPDVIVLPAFGATILAGVLSALWSGSPGRIVAMLLGALGLFAVFYLLAMIAPSALGFGDVKLAGLVGSAVGYAAPSLLLAWAVLLAPVAVVSIVVERLVVPDRRTGGWRSHVAFGPVMLGAVWLLYLLIAYLRP